MKNEVYYITVYGPAWSLFDVRVTPITDYYLELGFDYPETGEVLVNEIVNYKLNLYGSLQTNITIQTQIKYGNIGVFV